MPKWWRHEKARNWVYDPNRDPNCAGCIKEEKGQRTDTSDVVVLCQRHFDVLRQNTQTELWWLLESATHALRALTEEDVTEPREALGRIETASEHALTALSLARRLVDAIEVSRPRDGFDD